MKNRKRAQFLAIALFICLGFHLTSQEICNNGIDDDNDGLLGCIENDCNNTIRQRVSRLVRKSLSFSKVLENHIGAIKYFLPLQS
jgi:hypothetical protein